MNNGRLNKYQTIPDRLNINNVTFKASNMVGYVDLIVEAGGQKMVTSLSLAEARDLNDLLKSEILNAVDVSDKKFLGV